MIFWDPWGRVNSGKNFFGVQTATVMSGLQTKTGLRRINLKTKSSSKKSVLPTGVTYFKMFLSSTGRSKLPMASLDQAIL